MAFLTVLWGVESGGKPTGPNRAVARSDDGDIAYDLPEVVAFAELVVRIHSGL